MINRMIFLHRGVNGKLGKVQLRVAIILFPMFGANGHKEGLNETLVDGNLLFENYNIVIDPLKYFCKFTCLIYC